MREQLAYARAGNQDSDTTLIFLHGSTMTKEGMLPFARQFDDYNGIVFDLTAHGASGGSEPMEISTFAEDVEYAVKELQKEGVVTDHIILLGYSMGGAIVSEIASRGILRLDGIVLLSSGANLKDYTPLVDDVEQMPENQFRTENILEALFGVDTPSQESERIAQMFLATKSADVVGYRDLLVSHQYKKLEAYRQIHIPVLLVHGCDDRIVLPGAAVEMWREVEQGELLLLPYSGHAAIYEDTRIVRDKIIQFVCRAQTE